MNLLEVRQLLVASRTATGQPHQDGPLRGQCRQVDLLAIRILDLEDRSLRADIDLLRGWGWLRISLRSRLRIIGQGHAGDEKPRRSKREQTNHVRLLVKRRGDGHSKIS